jgi:hypothetical protein
MSTLIRTDITGRTNATPKPVVYGRNNADLACQPLRHILVRQPLRLITPEFSQVLPDSSALLPFGNAIRDVEPIRASQVGQLLVICAAPIYWRPHCLCSFHAVGDHAFLGCRGWSELALRHQCDLIGNATSRIEGVADTVQRIALANRAGVTSVELDRAGNLAPPGPQAAKLVAEVSGELAHRCLMESVLVGRRLHAIGGQPRYENAFLSGADSRSHRQHVHG